MLKAELYWEAPAERFEVVMSIANVGAGPVTNYAVTVGSEKQGEAPLLLNYPRWSEPVGGLVARCLAIRRESIERSVVSKSVERFGCQIALLSYETGPKRLLENVTVEPSNRRFIARSVDAHGNEQRCKYFSEANGHVTLLVEAICQVLWRAPNLPPHPRPLELPTFNNGVAYVRLADIPRWVLPVFDKFIGGRRCPAMVGESGPCVYARDWRAFLG